MLWLGVALVACVGPMVYLARHYAALPARVPMQIGIDGTPNYYGPKFALWVFAGVPLALTLLIYLTATPQVGKPWGTPASFALVNALFLAPITTAALSLLMGRMRLRQFLWVFVPALVGFSLLMVTRSGAI